MNYFTQILEDFFTKVGIDASQTYFSNTVSEYALALGAFVVFIVVFKIFQLALIQRLKKLAQKTETDVDDTLIEIIESLKPPFYSYLAFYLAARILTLSNFVEQILGGVLIVWIIYQAISAVQILITYMIERRFKDDTDAATRTALIAVGKIVKGALWAVGLLMVLSNLGVDITSLVAGLGIGGIAIAFALQNILTDLFSSFAIYFDKPFLVGDFIEVGSHSGTVEKIGIKSTRIRSTTGEELIISNKELTSVRIQNYKRLTERRLRFSIGVLYETPTEKLRAIPNIIQSIIEAAPKTRFDRVHFKEFADSALTFEISCYIQTSAYGEFMDIRQEINLGIFEKFKKEGIVFAYPTQTLYIEKN